MLQVTKLSENRDFESEIQEGFLKEKGAVWSGWDNTFHFVGPAVLGPG